MMEAWRCCGAQPVFLHLRLDGAEGIVQRIHKQPAHHLMTSARRLPGTSTTTAPRPGVPGGKFAGRMTRGSASR